MQDYNDNNQDKNIRRSQGGRAPSGGNGSRIPNARPSGARASSMEGGQPRRQQPRPAGQPRSAEQPRRPVRGQQAVSQPRPSSQQRRPAQGQYDTPGGQPRRPVQGQRAAQGGQQMRRSPQQGAPRRPQGQTRPGGYEDRMPRSAAGAPNRNANVRKKPRNSAPPQHAAKKKRRKIVLFVSEIFLLLILAGVLWAVTKAQKVQLVKIDENDVIVNEGVGTTEIKEGSSSQKGYRNIALFGVDSRNKQLDKSTRTDVIMIASINLDTNEVRLISVYRDTWLNLSTDAYNKANAAYAKGGPAQAISMLNMNLDLDITDFVTVGFDALIDVIDAVGGVEIDVKEAEVVHLNNYQISMVGKVVGKNANGDDEYYAEPGTYTPVAHAGLQTLNGLQATAYCRIRYVGDDFQRTERQRTVLTLVAKKAMTMNVGTLNKIAESIAGEMATSLDMSEIWSLLSGIASYKIGEQSGFPFEEYRQTGRIKGASVVIPVDLNKNVKELHKFLFDKEDYEPSESVKKCSKKIAADSGVSYNGE